MKRSKYSWKLLLHRRRLAALLISYKTLGLIELIKPIFRFSQQYIVHMVNVTY